MAGCCAYHKSCYTNLAILLALCSFITSLASVYAFLVSLLTFILVLFITCCRVRRCMLIVIMVLAFTSSICNFVSAANPNELCNDDKTSCKKSPYVIFGCVGGILWMITTALLYKVPETDPRIEESDSSPEMIRMQVGKDNSEVV